jgi:hypothetical protein
MPLNHPPTFFTKHENKKDNSNIKGKLLINIIIKAYKVILEKS